MIKKTFTFTDFNGVERTEEHWFHLFEADLIKMEFGVKGGLAEHIEKIVKALDSPSIMEVIEDLIRLSYGVKSDDGRGFIKNDEVYQSFKQTEAYSMLFVELTTNSEKAAEFVKGLIPAKLASQLPEDLTNTIA